MLHLSDHVLNTFGSECDHSPNTGLGVCTEGAAGTAVWPELRRLERRLRHHRDVLRQAPVERGETLQPLGAHLQGTVVAGLVSTMTMRSVTMHSVAVSAPHWALHE